MKESSDQNGLNKFDFRRQLCSFGNMLVDIIFPPACPVCGSPLDYNKGRKERICRKCADKLEYIKEPYCMKCGKQIEEEKEEYCYDCQRKKHSYDRGIAVYQYTEAIKQSIYRFKYQGKREYASFYAREAAKRYGRLIAEWKIDVIIPVPMYKPKKRRRGYNQAELIAQELGKYLNISVNTEVLERFRKTIPMKELNDVERIKNVENAFNIKTNVVKYKKVLLVDDIYTTGATIDQCSKILKEHGVEKVYFFCLSIGKGF